MADIGYLEQLLDSMNEGVKRLEVAMANNKTEQANQLRTFIFDIHRRIKAELGGKV